jgi:hypothetical protein
MADDYQISEEDIDVMLKNLEFSDPNNATRENAKTKRSFSRLRIRSTTRNSLSS